MLNVPKPMLVSSTDKSVLFSTNTFIFTGTVKEKAGKCKLSKAHLKIVSHKGKYVLKY